MSLPWIKLYCEILDDPKMGRMSEFVFARCIKLFLIAGREGKDGMLPPVEDMLWTMRLDESKLLLTLHELEEVGVTSQDPVGNWYIVNFQKRQSLCDSTERVRAFRERKKEKEKKKEGVTDVTVTPFLSVSSSSLDSSSSDSYDSKAASIIAQATNSNNGYVRREEKLYQAVTAQACMPPTSLTHDMTALQALLDHYGTNLERAIAEGKEVFGVWCNTTSKAGKPYSKTNTAWLDKWLDKIAPQPDNPHASSMDGILNAMRKEMEAAQQR